MGESPGAARAPLHGLGHGSARPGPSTGATCYNIMREAENVAAVVDATGEPTAVVGHSNGAACSLEAALLTDAIRALVLYESPIRTGLPMNPPNLPDRMRGSHRQR